MQSAENLTTCGPDAAVSPEQLDSEPATAPAPAETPLLGQDQIAQLQKILRSMDRSQLQTVLAALEPNVLRLCLHAIFGPQPTAKSAPEQESSAIGLVDHAKILGQSKAAGAAQSAKPSEPADQGRLSPRTPTQKNAKLHSASDDLTVDCLILDTSETGALIFLDHDGALPDTFDLYDLGHQKSGEAFTHLPCKACKQVWRKRNKLGVRFID